MTPPCSAIAQCTVVRPGGPARVSGEFTLLKRDRLTNRHSGVAAISPPRSCMEDPCPASPGSTTSTTRPSSTRLPTGVRHPFQGRSATGRRCSWPPGRPPSGAAAFPGWPRGGGVARHRPGRPGRLPGPGRPRRRAPGRAGRGRDSGLRRASSNDIRPDAHGPWFRPLPGKDAPGCFTR
jgi:hypothetical protein